LKDLGLAFHSYFDTYRQFPPQAVFSKDGKPLLSWRVLVLPYLGKEYKELYGQFHLDEPWDSEHNKKLLAKMPSVYAAPGSKTAQAHETHYRAFVDHGAFFDGKQPTKIGDVRDGLSQTITVVEAEKSVPWTKPEELPFNPDGPLPKLGGLFKGGFNALFADGHVRFCHSASTRCS
jgi:prepilin-type processing-associated H-X9-DG protein